MEAVCSTCTFLGCCVGIAAGGLVFAAYKLGLLYQLFHKVGCYMVIVTVPSVTLSTCRLQIYVIKHSSIVCLLFQDNFTVGPHSRKL